MCLLFIVCYKLLVKYKLFCFCISKNYIMSTRKVDFCISLCLSSIPYYLIPEILFPKYTVQYNFQVMAGRRVTMQIQAAGIFQNTAHLDKTTSHHRQVGHHVVFAEERTESRHECCCQLAGIGILQQLMIFRFCLFTPMPCIFKSCYLGTVFPSSRRGKKRIIIAI